MKRYWISWYGCTTIHFELDLPWWINGYRFEGQPMICAAVLAENEFQAKNKIKTAHDKKVELEWKFCEEKEDDWSPFSEQFPQKGWMTWPSNKTYDEDKKSIN